jgi:hypothetical protein
LNHEILPRREDRSPLGQLLGWFRRRAQAKSWHNDAAAATPQLVSSGRLQPREDETSSEFAERVAAIKADVLRRALEAVSVERFGGDSAPHAERKDADTT